MAAAALYAQTTTTPPPPQPVPSHAVSGDVTIDVADVQVPTSYGNPETRAAISVCTTKQYQQVGIQITGIPASDGTQAYDSATPNFPLRANNSYCATFVTIIPQKQIQAVNVYTGLQTSFQSAPTQSTTQASQQRASGR